MVAAELVMLFFIGEIIGRGSLVGYDVSRIKPVVSSAYFCILLSFSSICIKQYLNIHFSTF